MARLNLSKEQLRTVQAKAYQIMHQRIEARKDQALANFDSLVPAYVKELVAENESIRQGYLALKEQFAELKRKLEKVGITHICDFDSDNSYQNGRYSYASNFLRDVACMYDPEIAELQKKSDNIELDLALMTCPDEVKAWLDSL